MAQMFNFGGAPRVVPLHSSPGSADDRAYYRRRIRQEEEAAKAATSREASKLHAHLASLYRQLAES